MTINSHLKYIILFSIIFCGITHNINATDKKTQLADSVQNLLRNTHLSDSLRTIHLSELSLMQYYLEMDDSKAHIYLSKAQAIANKLEDQDLQVFIYAVKVQICSDTEGVKQSTDSCLFYTERAKNPLIRSIGWQAIANTKRNTPLAFEYIEKALNEIEGEGCWLQEQSLYYDFIHNSYSTTQTYPEAIEYAQLSLAAAKKTTNNYIIAKSWAELGIAYLMNSSLNQENDSLFNLAQAPFMQTLAMYKDGTVDLSARENQLLYNTALINLSNIEKARGNTTQAIQYLEEALNNALQYDTSDEIDYNMKPYIYHSAKSNILQCYTTLSAIHKSLKKYDKAEKYLLSAISFLPKNQLDDSRNGNFPSHRLSISLADLYYEIGRYNDAVTYYNISYAQYAEYYKYSTEGIIGHMQKAYDKERKKQELTVLEESLSQNHKNTYLFIILIAFLITSCILLHFLQRYRLKSNKQRKNLYEREKKILEILKGKTELEARLNTYETEKYKKELLTENLLVENKNKVIEELRGFFANNPSLNKYKEELDKILETDSIAEVEINDFNTSFQGTSHSLYEQLQEYADNKLTPLDLKYCHMTLMKMSSKEMAEMLHVDAGTIRVNKYRLKQKFKLEKSEDLATFIQKINNNNL